MALRSGAVETKTRFWFGPVLAFGFENMSLAGLVELRKRTILVPFQVFCVLSLPPRTKPRSLAQFRGPYLRWIGS